MEVFLINDMKAQNGIMLNTSHHHHATFNHALSSCKAMLVTIRGKQCNVQPSPSGLSSPHPLEREVLSTQFCNVTL